MATMLVSSARFITLVVVHSLWQSTVLLLIYLTLSWRLKQYHPRARYALSLLALSCMAIVPVVSAVVTLNSTILSSEDTTDSISHVIWHMYIMRPTETPLTIRAGSAALTASNAGNFVDRYTVLLALLWLTGSVLLCARKTIAWMWLQHALRQSKGAKELKLGPVISAVMARMGVRRHVTVVVLEECQSPYVFGIFKSTIVFPVSLMTALTSDMVETIIAHELAHVMRWDFLINLYQSSIETVLFFHPAIWYVSGRIRDEREECCDSAVVAYRYEKITYARALVTLASRETPSPPVLAAGSGRLKMRISRILGDRSMKHVGWGESGLAIIGFMCLAIMLPAICAKCLPNAFTGTIPAQVSVNQNESTRAATVGRAADLSIETDSLTITLRDSKKRSTSRESVPGMLIHDSDLQRLAQQLWGAGAFMLEINGTKLTTGSDIHAHGSDILADSAVLVPPFVITAWGDSANMVKAIDVKGGVIEQLRRIDPEMVTFRSGAEGPLQATPQTLGVISKVPAYKIALKITYGNVSANGKGNLKVIASPTILTVAGSPAEMTIRSSDTGISVNITPNLQKSAKISLTTKVSLNRDFKAKGTINSSLTPGVDTPIMGLTDSVDDKVQRAVHIGKLAPSRSAYKVCIVNAKVVLVR